MICLDTMILIWAIQGFESDQRSAEEDCAVALIEKLDEQNERVILPTAVLVEFLHNADRSKTEQRLAFFQERFVIASFDLKSAVVAAEIMNHYKKPEKRPETSAPGEGRRLDAVRTDAIILGTAIANGANRIVSNDRHMKSLAGTLIIVEPLPRAARQTTMDFKDE